MFRSLLILLFSLSMCALVLTLSGCATRDIYDMPLIPAAFPSGTVFGAPYIPPPSQNVPRETETLISNKDLGQSGSNESTTRQPVYHLKSEKNNLKLIDGGDMEFLCQMEKNKAKCLNTPKPGKKRSDIICTYPGKKSMFDCKEVKKPKKGEFLI